VRTSMSRHDEFIDPIITTSESDDIFHLIATKP
jgi:hypothetical protein